MFLKFFVKQDCPDLGAEPRRFTLVVESGAGESYWRCFSGQYCPKFHPYNPCPAPKGCKNFAVVLVWQEEVASGVLLPAFTFLSFHVDRFCLAPHPGLPHIQDRLLHLSKNLSDFLIGQYRSPFCRPGDNPQSARQDSPLIENILILCCLVLRHFPRMVRATATEAVESG